MDAPAREVAPAVMHSAVVHSRWPSTLIRRLSGLSWERGRPSSKVERRRNGTRSRIAVPERLGRAREYASVHVQRCAPRGTHTRRESSDDERTILLIGTLPRALASPSVNRGRRVS